MSHLDPPSTSLAVADGQLLRIQEVAAALGLTTRTIRYYEEVGLLAPAGRSGGDYRLYDADDIERLRFIKGLRDDAGFSLAEIGRLLEDEAARTRNRDRFRSTSDATERRAIIDDALGRVYRQIASLREKIERLEEMIAEAEGRRTHLLDHTAELDAGAEPAPHDHRPRRR
jgi:DNA-binding transcriptional MerR regulator